MRPVPACAIIALGGYVAAQGVLVFTKATDYYHASIPTAEQAIEHMGEISGFPVLATNDSTIFSDEGLANISVVAFVSNSEPLDGPPILDSDQQSAFLRWLVRGGGYVGVHAASACLFSAPFYQTLVGAYFNYHPDLQQASFLVLNRSNPSTSSLPSPWTYVEEVYSFTSDPRSNNVTVFMTVQNGSYSDPNATQEEAPYDQGTPHPIAWWREASTPGLDLGNGSYYPGRTWYSSLGHTIETWQNATFLEHVQNGILWVLETSVNSTFTNRSISSISASATSNSARAVAAATSPPATTVTVKSDSAQRAAWTLSPLLVLVLAHLSL